MDGWMDRWIVDGWMQHHDKKRIRRAYTKRNRATAAALRTSVSNYEHSLGRPCCDVAGNEVD